jgi:hypothetical protein
MSCMGAKSGILHVHAQLNHTNSLQDIYEFAPIILVFYWIKHNLKIQKSKIYTSNHAQTEIKS